MRSAGRAIPLEKEGVCSLALLCSAAAWFVLKVAGFLQCHVGTVSLQITRKT